MKNLKCIVAATDFSPASDAAVLQASRLAVAHDCSLHCVHTIPAERHGLLSLHGDVDAAMDEMRATAIKELTDYLDQAGVSANVHVRVGKPAMEIAAVIEEVSADLLVIGAVGEHGKRWGTVSSRCVRKIPAPVLLVPAGQHGEFGRILACVDLMPSSLEIVEHALCVSADGSKTLAVHCFEVPWERARFGVQAPSDALERMEQFRQSLHSQYRSMVVEKLSAPAPELELLQAIDSGAAIVEFATEWNADLVVVGTTSRSGLAYMLLGTTAEKIMRDTTCAVLSLKSLE